MHLIDLSQAYAFIEQLFERHQPDEVAKLKSRLKSLARRAPVFKSEEEELDLGEMLF